MIDMERKIGEIFEYNGEWYQCIPDTTDDNCNNCFFQKRCSNITGDCSSTSRSDGKSVAFKKLEKVGESFYSKYLGKSYQRYKTYIPAVGSNFKIRVTPVEYVGRNEIFIEIKQKEDMEENKTPLPKEDNPLTRVVYAYVNGKISDNELIKSIKEMPDEYPYRKNNLKPFDIQKAREGKPVCTRDGRKARIICFDRNDLYPIVALIECEDGKEIIGAYSKEGQTEIYEIKGTNLMMLPEKKEGWIVIHKEAIYDKETAEKIARETTADVIRIQKIEWEE